MYQKEIYEAALSRIQARRLAAKAEQERRTAQIHRELPETVALDRMLHDTCLSILRAAAASGTDDVSAQVAAIEHRCNDAQTMLSGILQAHGYSEDYLALHYTCTRCNDTGFVGGIPCECLKREIGKVGAEKINAQSQLSLCSFETFSLHYYNHLPPAQQQQMRKIYETCWRYATEFSAETSENLLMIGATGLGKTHLSLSIANVVLQNGFSVIYDTVGGLMHRLEQEHFGNADRGDDTLSNLLDCDLLILDDFGTEFDTKFSRSMIYTLLNSRINAGKPVIVNTNITSKQISERYSERVASRLISFTILQFYGKDIRALKRFEQRNG